MNKYLPIFLTPCLLALLLLLAVSPLAFSQKENSSPALSSLVEAERSFARTSVEKGIRASFYEFFADDGINFQPHPTNTREAIRKQPAPAQRPPITLNWEPVYADISRAGDLGYTTGPYWVTDEGPQHRPTRHGYYFSIWKKQADGSWKVVIDLGVQTPAPATSSPPAFHPAPSSQFKPKSAKPNLETERAALLNLEREFLQAANSNGVTKAFQSFMSDEARLHRNGMLPLTGKDSIRSYFSGKEMTLRWEPIKADVSQSDDLGYTYGSYEQKEQQGASAATVEKGYYVRVWKRNKDGQWKLVLDTTNPIPPEGQG
jgi:ketosteroid isomerase-like protein